MPSYSFRPRRAHRVALIAAFVILSNPFSLALAEKVRVDIEAGNAQQTLAEFMRQTRLQILFKFDTIHDYATQAVSGELDATDALSRMLAGSGLRFDFVNARTVSITTADMAANGTTLVTEPASNDGQAEVDSVLAASQERGVVRLAQADKKVAFSPPQTSRDDDTKRASDGQGKRNQEDIGLDEVVITGTHIRGVVPESSPITIYTRKDIEQSGVATVEQFARLLPQNFASMDSISISHTNNASGFDQQGSNGYGGVGFNLRGLGPGSTLVLVNGNRLSSSGFGDGIDVSMIPLSAIEQIEVLPDGASAIYGADAVAGVVNFALRKDFTGAETTLRYGGTSGGGAAEVAASQLLGTTWGSGNASLIYEYVEKKPLLSTDRDFIPDLGGPATLAPGHDRQSVFFAGEQDVSGTTLSADLSYSYRGNTVSDAFLFSQFSRGIAYSKQYRAILSARRGLFADWRGELTGNYSKVEQGLKQYIESIFVFDSSTDTAFYAADAKLDGSLFSLPGGKVRLAVGSGAHKESVRNPNGLGNLERKSSNLYAEAIVPLIGASNAKPWAQRLELSIAGRYDRYDDFGSSVNPKVGMRWEPIQGFALRGSYTTSFHPPQLFTSLRIPGYIVYDVPDASQPDGFITTLFDVSSGTNDLDPETSDSFNIGLDLKPSALPGVSISLSYFNTDFADRIGSPPLIGNDVFSLYSQTDTLGPFIDFPADAAEVAGFFATNQVFDLRFISNPDPGLQPLAPELVESTYDSRVTNIASTKQSGIDLSSTYERRTYFGELAFSLAGTYFLENKYQTVSTTPFVSLLNVPSQPMDLRMRATAGWSKGGLGTVLAVNYADGYNNTLTAPHSTVASWATTDLQLRYRFREDSAPWVFRDLALTLSVQNLTDEEPPRLRVSPAFIDFGFDASNASPIGRFTSLQISKRW